MYPLVTIVVPCYNHAHYLSNALVSTINQTYSNWEALIIDDGSIDNTAEVAAQFTDPRIRYIYQENQGLSAARNTAVKAATGAYLAFLDADDEWYPEFLSRCMSVIKANESPRLAGVYTSCVHIDENSNLLPQPGNITVPPEELYCRLLEGGFFPPNTVVVRTDLVKEAGLFDTQLTSLEDTDMWLRLSKRYLMTGIPEPLARYRISPGSMASNIANMHANRMAVLSKHLGPPEGDPAGWPLEKRRAFGFGYRVAALSYIRQGQLEEGWQLLRKAVLIWPDLLSRLDTFYELACGNQPRGYRGQTETLNLDKNSREMFRELDYLFKSTPLLTPMRKRAYGYAYLALGMLSDQAGDWSTARHYFFKSVKVQPNLLSSCSLIRRFLKLCVGQRVVGLGRFVSGAKARFTTSF